MTRREKCTLCWRCLNIMNVTDVEISVTVRFIFQSISQKYPKFSTNGKIALSSTKVRFIEIMSLDRPWRVVTTN